MATPSQAGQSYLYTDSTKTALWGSVAVLIYEDLTGHPVGYFRDTVTGATSTVSLPDTIVNGNDWWRPVWLVLNGNLWAVSGGGPVYVREWSLSGSPLPTSATQIEKDTFGDTCARSGDMIALTSGALLVAYHGQGYSCPEYQTLEYRSVAGTWTATGPLTFGRTQAGKQRLAESGGITRLYNLCDGCGVLGMAKLTDDGSTLTVVSTNSQFVGPNDGDNDVESEIPGISAQGADVAYNDGHYNIFSTSPFVKGAYLTVMTVAADDTRTFVTDPVWAERISAIGIDHRNGTVRITDRHIDTTTLTFDKLYLDSWDGTSWSSLLLGQMYQASEEIAVGPNGVVVRLTDGDLHWLNP